MFAAELSSPVCCSNLLEKTLKTTELEERVGKALNQVSYCYQKDYDCCGMETLNFDCCGMEMLNFYILSILAKKEQYYIQYNILLAIFMLMFAALLKIGEINISL